MSARRNVVAAPFLTLIASFALILVLGSWVGTTKTVQKPIAPTPSQTSRVIHIRMENLRTSDNLEWFPGIRVKVIQGTAEKIGVPTGGSSGADTAKVCITPPPKLVITSAGWNQGDASTLCRSVHVTAGKVDPVELDLEQR